jgi:hypothetical protein
MRYGRRGATHRIRTFWVRPTKSPPYKDSPQVQLLLYTISLTVLKPFYLRLAYNWTQHANWWLLHRVPYGHLLCCHSPKDSPPLGAYTYGVTHDVNRTICFSAEYIELPLNICNALPLRALHLSHHWIILMATKASQTPHFQPKPTMWELLNEVNLNHRSSRKSTSSTNLMPICPHLPLRIVLLWYRSSRREAWISFHKFAMSPWMTWWDSNPHCPHG